MHLVIDIGNTLIKIGIFEKENLKIHTSFTHDDFAREMQLIAKKFSVKRTTIASVGKLSEQNKKLILSLFDCNIIYSDSKVPFENLYATPHTLGVDRIAVASAAVHLFPNQNVLVIDAGTCITYDFVNSEKKYLGGAISPGVHTRYKSLHEFTANLPLLEKQVPENLTGNSTAHCIHSGVVNGAVFELDGVISRYKEMYKDLKVILTGGDAEFLEKQLDNTVEIKPFFLLEGLYYISKLNYD